MLAGELLTAPSVGRRPCGQLNQCLSTKRRRGVGGVQQLADDGLVGDAHDRDVARRDRIREVECDRRAGLAKRLRPSRRPVPHGDRVSGGKQCASQG